MIEGNRIADNTPSKARRSPSFCRRTAGRDRKPQVEVKVFDKDRYSVRWRHGSIPNSTPRFTALRVRALRKVFESIREMMKEGTSIATYDNTPPTPNVDSVQPATQAESQIISLSHSRDTNRRRPTPPIKQPSHFGSGLRICDGDQLSGRIIRVLSEKPQ
jgi:hypothetical protein